MRLNSPSKWFILKLCDTVSLEKLKQISDVIEVTFQQSIILPNGEQIKTSNKQVVITMDLLLNNILHLSQEEINNSKIEFNMQPEEEDNHFLIDG